MANNIRKQAALWVIKNQYFMFDNWIELGLALLLTALAISGWVANVLGMPGNWLIAVMAVACWLWRPADLSTHVAWLPLLALVLVAGLGELLEFAASALGVSRMGGSRRGTLLSIVGSVSGAIAGLFVGTLIPIPIVGSLLGSLLLGAAGAFAGAIVGERWIGRDWDSSLQIGGAAFWGRLLGTVGKAVCGTVVCAVFIIAIWF